MKSFKEFLNENLNKVVDLTKGEASKEGEYWPGKKVKTEVGQGEVVDAEGVGENAKLKVKLDSGKTVKVDLSGKMVK